MKKSTLDRIWNDTRQKYGVYLRLLDAIPTDRFNDEVVPGMRTPAEMVAHTSGTLLRDIAVGVAEGEIKHDHPEAEIAANLTTKADAIAFARACWEASDEAVSRIGDDELSAVIPTPWDMSIPGSFAIHVINDELLHHRGQLYAYARLCGVEPPFLWSFAENGEGFRPSD